jgi:hypothetical protein
MKRPEITEEDFALMDKRFPDYRDFIRLCGEIRYLKGRINDMALGCEVDETTLPKSPAENPV